jgi:hypothetical protein
MLYYDATKPDLPDLLWCGNYSISDGVGLWFIQEGELWDSSGVNPALRLLKFPSFPKRLSLVLQHVTRLYFVDTLSVRV